MLSSLMTRSPLSTFDHFLKHGIETIVQEFSRYENAFFNMGFKKRNVDEIPLPELFLKL